MLHSLRLAVCSLCYCNISELSDGKVHFRPKQQGSAVVAQGSAYGRNGLDRQGMGVVCPKESADHGECHAVYCAAAHHGSVFIKGDERGLHHDYEVWLEPVPPHAPTGLAGCTTTPAKLAAKSACGKPLSWTKGQAADAHLTWHGHPSEAVVVAVTSGRLDGSIELAEVHGI